jgi:hypothetical protein
MPNLWIEIVSKNYVMQDSFFHKNLRFFYKKVASTIKIYKKSDNNLRFLLKNCYRIFFQQKLSKILIFDPFQSFFQILRRNLSFQNILP